MSAPDEITRWIRRLSDGDEAAAVRIWEAYWERLVALARRKLSASRRRVSDEEDVALSAFDSFCRAATAGRFPKLNDRHDLWRLLLTITARKARVQITYERAQKRRDHKVRGDSAFEAVRLDEMLGESPTAELAVMATEECERLLDCLQDSVLRAVALSKLEGYSVREIAEQIDCSPGTVQRHLRRIRGVWSHEGE